MQEIDVVKMRIIKDVIDINNLDKLKQISKDLQNYIIDKNVLDKSQQIETAYNFLCSLPNGHYIKVGLRYYRADPYAQNNALSRVDLVKEMRKYCDALWIAKATFDAYIDKKLPEFT